jgi:GTP-binding protein
MVHDVQFVTGATTWERLPAGVLPEVAFIGRSNVGKSSLINMVLGRRAVARTSRTPGKTQQFNYYLVDGMLHFVDLPGYGYARVARTQREKWGRFIGRYLKEREQLRVAFHLVDSRHPPTELDRDVMVTMRGSPVPYVIALTKTDKLSGNARARGVAAVKKALDDIGLEVPIVVTSAQDGRGRDEIWNWIASFVESR